MFREMRKSNKELSKEHGVSILEKGEYGILSTTGDNGYCYGVPLSYVYYDNAIYFHSALEGHKVDNLQLNNKVSFTVVGKTEVLPSRFSTKYESVIAFGQATEICDDEKIQALKELILKYSKDFLESGMKYIKVASDKTKVFKITIDKLSAKTGNN
ncbi:pyridoxamine 5'-phosphate oxidase family protein [Clostridium sp.]|uniref:pyridoxamine 5'-phosphate oxidase family protein n=1 Tax=Clostridium sp. TaxID=1506 RepID=UPI003464707A